MGFPYDKADWSVVDGAMFMGANSSMPLFYTIIAIITVSYTHLTLPTTPYV